MIDLTTRYMGFNLKNPIVPSASPLMENVDAMKRMEDVGAAALVMNSLFEEQIIKESAGLHHYMEYGNESFAEALSYFPEPDEFKLETESYLERVRKAVETVDIPVIGSLNGITTGGWAEYATLIEEAGAKGLELNIYYIPTDPDVSGSEIEERYLEVVREVRAKIRIPLAVKIGPFFSAPVHMAKQFALNGANAIVLFNRFYQPDLNLETLEVEPHLVYSNSSELRLPLRWTAIMYGKIPADMAITSGVHTHIDVLKCMMAGANVAQMASELLKNGIERIGDIITDLEMWLEDHGYNSIAEMEGSMSHESVAAPDAYERANYMKVLHSWRSDPTGWLPS